MTQHVTRNQVLSALATLDVDPKTAEEVIIMQDRIIVRYRTITTIQPDVPEEEHTHG